MGAFWLVGLAIGLFGVFIWAVNYDAKHGWKEYSNPYSNEFDK
jgi:chitinase